MTALMQQPDKDDFILIPVEDFKAHMDRTAACVGVLNGIMSALSQNPMFAGFLPPDLREQIAKLS